MHTISPLEELVGGYIPPSSSQRLTGMQLCVVKHKKRGYNVYEAQLCVVKYEKEVTRYMKYSCV